MDLAMDLNVTGDMLFVNGECPVVTYPADRVAQRLAIRLRTIEGEWFLDTSYGVPWFNILGQKINLSQADHILQREVLSVRGVGEITSWSSEITTSRHYIARFTVRTSRGDLTESLTITPPSTI